MPQVQLRNANEQVIVVTPLDSMGRSPELIEAMEKNDPKPIKAKGHHAAFGLMVAQQCAVYPKVMYKLALRKGIPAGDEVDPNYPMPYDLAQSIGIADKGFKVMGKTKDSGGYIVRRHPYRTQLCGVQRPDFTIDVEASQKHEKALLADGWVDSLSKVKGLPKSTDHDEDFDEPPTK